MSACPNDEILSAYVEQKATDRAAIEEHLDGCKACRVVVGHLAAVGVMVDELKVDPDRTHQTGPTEDLAATEADAALLFGPPLARGTRVDRYVVDGELGRGGMGVVLLAHDPQLARTVALKIVRPGTSDESARAGLLREARAMARLSHPNVVAIHDVGELDDGRVFLAMEHVRGTTLRRALAGEERSSARTIDLFLQAGKGLAAAHAVGLIHRDFKPENVLVGDDGRVRVTDFGLARGTSGPGVPASLRGGHDAAVPPSGLTRTGAIVGTPAYMAPEQTLGLAATPATDQFAFAVALFEALTGMRPFAGTTFEEIAKAKVGGDRRAWPPSPIVSPELMAIVDRGLARAPEERHASMNALLELLERARESAPRSGRSRAVVSLLVVAVVAVVAVIGAATVRARSGTAVVAPNASVACVDGARAMTAIWGDVKRNEVRAALSTKTAAPIAVDETLATLDRQAREWTTMHDASCAATRDSTQPEPAFRLRAACLRRRWNELVEMIDVLAHEPPDPDDAFAGDPLGSVRACADLRTLAATEPPPPDPAELARVEDFYARIARARAMSKGTWASMNALAADVARVKWSPVVAEHALLGAELAATIPMEEAIRLAETSRDDELVARARRAYARKQIVAGTGAFVELSGALAAATKLERPDLRADVLEQRAVAEKDFGRFAAALVTATEALALREGGAESPRRPRALWIVDLTLVRAEAAIEQGEIGTARDALRVLEPVPDDAVKAARLVLAGRVAIAEGHADAARPLLAEARTLAANVAHADLVKSSTRERRAWRIAEEALFASMWAMGVAEHALGRRDEAERALVDTLNALTERGFGLAPIVQARAVLLLNRIQRGKVPAPRALARAKRAFELVEPLEPAPIAAEALIALGEALVGTGDAAGAIARLTHAEVLARDAPVWLRVECATALLGASRARGADPAALPRANEIARRALADANADTPGRAALEALLTRPP